MSNSPVKTTNKQNVRIIEHYPLCTMSLIKTRQTKSICRRTWFIDENAKWVHRQEGIVLSFRGERKRNICYYSNCKQQEKDKQVSSFPLETTQADTFAAHVQGTEPVPPFFKLFDSRYSPKYLFHYWATWLTISPQLWNTVLDIKIKTKNRLQK